MKVGDLVRATWSDGLSLVGVYSGKEQGYIILIGEDGKKIVCNQAIVQFEVIGESR